MNNDADKTQAIHKNQQNHSHNCNGDCCSHSHTSNLEGDGVHSLEALIINSQEKAFLMEFVKYNYLPVSRFIMSSSVEEFISNSGKSNGLATDGFGNIYLAQQGDRQI